MFSKEALCVFRLFFEKMSFGICLPPLMDLVFSNVRKVSLLFCVGVAPSVFLVGVARTRRLGEFLCRCRFSISCSVGVAASFHATYVFEKSFFLFSRGVE